MIKVISAFYGYIGYLTADNNAIDYDIYGQCIYPPARG